jgi:polyvinyl alcohol dehydrogenase (cytochrome)
MRRTGDILLMACALLQVSMAQQPQAQQQVTEGAGSTIFGNACGKCHGKLDEAPPPEMLKKLTPEKIYDALTAGVMKTQAAGLTDQQKRDIAEWVGGRKLGATGSGDAKIMSNPCPANPPIKDLTSAPAWNGWSPDMTNLRFQSAKAAGLSPAAVGRLRLKWAFGLPSASSSYGQPTVVDGRVFVSSDSGYFYSIDAASGCVHWSFQAQSGIRSASTIGAVKTASGAASSYAAFFGDIRGNVYAVNAANGELLWKAAIDPHPLSRITGAIRYRVSPEPSGIITAGSTSRLLRSKSRNHRARIIRVAPSAGWSPRSTRPLASRSGKRT